jgi:hypothetical protein
MTDPQSHLTQLACMEALGNQQHNLVETIGSLLEIMKSLPDGEARNQLLDEISCLDVLAEVMRMRLERSRQ